MRQNNNKTVFKPNGDNWGRLQNSVFWISTGGEIINQNTGKTIKRKHITTKYGSITIKQAIAWVFNGIEPIKGRIINTNKNKKDINPKNLRYSIKKEVKPINRELLLKALRCYFSIEKNKKPHTNDVLTKFYLKLIIEKRQFIERNEKEPFIDIFKDWIYKGSIEKVAIARNIAFINVRAVVSEYTNRILEEINKELQEEKLILQPYRQTEREKRKQETLLLHEKGYKRKSYKVTFPKDVAEQMRGLGIEPPIIPKDWGAAKLLPKGAKLIILLFRAQKLIQEHEKTTTNKNIIRECSELSIKINNTVKKIDFFK